MTRKDKLYITGSIICFSAIGFVIFYSVKQNKPDNAGQAVAAQNNSPQVAASQFDASQPEINQPASTEDNATIPDPASNGNITPPDKSNSGHPPGPWQNLPAGSKPFFGQISAVSGNQITLSSRNNTSVTVTLSSGTEFDGGTRDQIVSSVRIAGYGTANSDGSITAEKITINPAMPSGGRFNRRSGDQQQ